MSTATMFRTLESGEAHTFVERAQEDAVGASLEELGTMATHETYHPIYRREMARHLFLALSDLAKEYES